MADHKKADEQPVETSARDVDVVALPSLRADGTPDQTAGFVQLVDDADDPRTGTES